MPYDNPQSECTLSVKPVPQTALQDRTALSISAIGRLQQTETFFSWTAGRRSDLRQIRHYCGPESSHQLTSRHQVVSQHGQAEVPCQGCQGGLDPWELLGEARGLRPKVAESAETEDAVGVVSKYVVPVG